MKHRTGHLFKRGTNFYLRWTVEGKVFSKALRDDNGQPITARREAEEARAKFMAPFTIGTEADALESIVGKLEGRKAELAKWEDEQNPPLSIGSAWNEYLGSSKRPDTGPDTLAVYAGQFGQFVDWMKETHPDKATLREVTEEIADQYASHLNHERLNPNTFNKHIRVLELVFRVLFKKAKLIANPWEGIQRKKLLTQNRRELTVDELKRVCESATGELRTLLALGIYTGMRLRDCATLGWGEVDLQRGFIRRIPNKIARKETAKPVIIPIHFSLRPMLEETPAEKRRGFVLPHTSETYTSGGSGKKQMIDKIQDHFTGQGIQIYKDGTGPGSGRRAVVQVGFHSLRHSFVSLCRASNVPLSVVESLVGHSNPQMTKAYTHTGELAASHAVATLPAIIGESKPAPSKPDPEALLVEVGAIVGSINGQNWREKKAAVLELVTSSNNGQMAVKASK